MNNLENLLIEAIAEYVDLVRHDHHKSRDCEFSITKSWTREFSGRVQSKWIAAHAGYRMEGYEIECESYDKARVVHLQHLQDAIAKEIAWLDENPDEDWRKQGVEH